MATNTKKLGLFIGIFIVIVVGGLSLAAFLQSRIDKRKSAHEIVSAQVSATATTSPSPLPTPTPVPSPTPSMAVQLATIDCSCLATENETSTRRFAYLLRELTRKTKQSEQEIADVSVNAKQIVHDQYGRDVSLLRVMELGNRSIPEAGSGRAKYQEVMSALIVMTKGELN